MVLEGDMTRGSCFKLGYTLCPIKKLSTHLFAWAWSWSDNRKFNVGSGHGSLNTIMAYFLFRQSSHQLSIGTSIQEQTRITSKQIT
jgi:hypothetical protein